MDKYPAWSYLLCCLLGPLLKIYQLILIAARERKMLSRLATFSTMEGFKESSQYLKLP